LNIEIGSTTSANRGSCAVVDSVVATACPSDNEKKGGGQDGGPESKHRQKLNWSQQGRKNRDESSLS